MIKYLQSSFLPGSCCATQATWNYIKYSAPYTGGHVVVFVVNYNTASDQDDSCNLYTSTENNNEIVSSTIYNRTSTTDENISNFHHHLFIITCRPTETMPMIMLIMESNRMGIFIDRFFPSGSVKVTTPGVNGVELAYILIWHWYRKQFKDQSIKCRPKVFCEQSKYLTGMQQYFSTWC